MLACPSCGSVYARAQEYCGLDGARLAEVDTDPLIGRKIGRYLIEATLGAGGMARVYRGRHEVLDKLAAVKVLHGELSADKQLSKRFEREARSLSRIRHPHVVQVVDFGRSDTGLLYMIMELVEGQTLAETLRRRGPLPVDEAARIAAQIARGLDAAHACGYVHRDLKPQNIVLDVTTVPPQVKILDFGLVGLVEGEENDTPLTRQGTFFGTPTYMSPEQSAGERASPASDLYALGVVLYELLTGRPPFSGDVRQLAQQHIHAAPTRPSDDFAGLADVALDLLQKNPRARPTSPVLVERLERLDVYGGEITLPSISGAHPASPAAWSTPPPRRPTAHATAPATPQDPPSEARAAALAVPIDRDEFSSLDRTSQIYEREALSATRRSRWITALVFLGALGAGGYGLYAWEARRDPEPAPLRQGPEEPALSANERRTLVGLKNGASSDRHRKLKPKQRAASPPTSAPSEPPPSPRRTPPEDARPEPRPTAMVVYAAFLTADDDLTRLLERRGIAWRELGLREPKAAERWSEWHRAKASVPRDDMEATRARLEAAIDRIADAEQGTLDARLEAAERAFDDLPTGSRVMTKVQWRDRLTQLRKRAAEDLDESERRSLLRSLDSLITEMKRAGR